jgi:hypothetical protein
VSTSLSKVRTASAVILVIEPLLFFAAFAVLANAIGWPASLGLPFNEVLPMVQAQLTEVRFGYGLYLFSSLLTLPLGLLLVLALKQEEPSANLWLAAAFMACAAVFKALGISRWLLAMPALATIHAEAASNPSTIEAVRVTYVALNEYAGGALGELMGVGLFTGLWAIMLGIALWGRARPSAVFLIVGGLVSLALVPDEFMQIIGPAPLQSISRTAIMLGEFVLAFQIWKGRV